MNNVLVEEIRRDLDLVFPRGGYTLTELRGEPRVRLTLEKGVHHNMRRFSEEILRLHNVSFETRHAGTPTAPR